MWYNGIIKLQWVDSMKLNKKRIAMFFGIIAALIIIICLFVAISICSYGEVDNKQNADVAIVLGAASAESGVSPVYQERINHAVWLYENGYVSYIITTGGVSEGNTRSDAEIAKEYAISCGIPADVILTESESSITEENLKYAKAIMAERDFSTCIVVSDPLHMKRAMLMAEDFGLTAFSSPTPTTRYQTQRTKLPFLLREEFFYIGYCILRPFR